MRVVRDYKSGQEGQGKERNRQGQGKRDDKPLSWGSLKMGVKESLRCRQRGPNCVKRKRRTIMVIDAVVKHTRTQSERSYQRFVSGKYQEVVVRFLREGIQ